jgi:hypothetical protein
MFNMMDSRLEMFNIGSLAVVTIERHDHMEKDVKEVDKEVFHAKIECRGNSRGDRGLAKGNLEKMFNFDSRLEMFKKMFNIESFAVVPLGHYVKGRKDAG